MGCCGAITALVPLISSYWSLCAVSGAFGFFIAANYSLTSIILVELITLEKFTNAYGLLLLVQGIANLVGPPLAGNYGLCYKIVTLQKLYHLCCMLYDFIRSYEFLQRFLTYDVIKDSFLF